MIFYIGFKELYSAQERLQRGVWGAGEGERYYRLLRGHAQTRQGRFRSVFVYKKKKKRLINCIVITRLLMFNATCILRPPISGNSGFILLGKCKILADFLSASLISKKHVTL